MLLTATTERAGVLVKMWLEYNAGMLSEDKLPSELKRLAEVSKKRTESVKMRWIRN